MMKPPQVHPSLGIPLQLSSLFEPHVSEALGWIEQGPQTPAEQVEMPPPQVPFEPNLAAQVPVAPLMQTHPWLGIPLQVSSFPETQVSESFG
jgi:hypothetical protein